MAVEHRHEGVVDLLLEREDMIPTLQILNVAGPHSGGRHGSSMNTRSSRPVRPRRGEDDEGRDSLVLGRDGLPPAPS